MISSTPSSFSPACETRTATPTPRGLPFWFFWFRDSFSAGASRKGNVAAILAALAPDAKIKITLMNPGSDKEVVQILDKEQYAFGLRQVLRRKIAYQLVRKNMRIKIYDAESATVTSELYETFKFREGTVRSSSLDVIDVNLRNGKLVITGTEARARLY